MALEIKIGIDVEGNALQKTKAIEQGLQDVTRAAKGTQGPIEKITGDVQGLATSTTKLSDAAHANASAFEKEVLALVRADGAAINAAKATDTLTVANSGLASSFTKVTGMSVSMAGTLAGLGVAYGGLAVFVGNSIREFAKQDGEMGKVSQAIDRMGAAWTKFEVEVGRRLVGGTGTAGAGLLNTITDVFEDMTPALAEAFTTASGLDRFSDQLRYHADAWSYLSLAVAQARGQLDNVSMPAIPPAPSGYGKTTPMQVPKLPGLSNGSWLENWGRTSSTAGGGGGGSRRVPTPWGWAQLETPGVTVGMGPAAGFQYPVGSPVFNWGSISPGVSGMPGSLPGYTGVGPGGLTPQAAGLWAQNGGFQQGMANVAYGSGIGWLQQAASAGQQVRAGINQGGIAGWTSAAGGMIGGAQSVWSATSEGGAGKRALKGAASGAMVGTMIFPGVGTAIGAGVGALVGAIRGWLAPTEYEKRKKDEAASREQAGEVLGRPGMERLWNSVGAGNVPFDFKFLKSQVEHDPGAIKGYLDDMLAKHERLQSAMEKYGISWEELGEKAKQSKIDAMAEELILDFDVLMGAGADTTLIIEKMGGAINEFVASALRTGSEVPAAMKPMIDKMIEMGLLVDADGNKIDSLEASGITFAKTMTQGFDAIVEAINRVAKGLGVDIPDAAKKAGDAIGGIPAPQYPEFEPRMPRVIEPGEGPYPGLGGGGPHPVEPAHTGGYLWNGRVLPVYHRGGSVRDGFPIWAQSGEFMMSRAAVNRIGAGALSAMNSGSGGGVTIVLERDGRREAQWLVPFIPGEVRRLGLA